MEVSLFRGVEVTFGVFGVGRGVKERILFNWERAEDVSHTAHVVVTLKRVARHDARQFEDCYAARSFLAKTIAFVPSRNGI